MFSGSSPIDLCLSFFVEGAIGLHSCSNIHFVLKTPGSCQDSLMVLLWTFGAAANKGFWVKCLVQVCFNMMNKYCRSGWIDLIEVSL